MNKTILTLIIVLLFLSLGYLVLGKIFTPEKNGVNTKIAPVSQADHQEGSATSSITVIEYADYECPACAAYHPVMKEVKQPMEGKALFVFRLFPLPMHANAIPAGVAAEAAGVQGAYFKMQDKLFDGQQEWSSAKNPRDIFIKYAKDLGLNEAQFIASLDDESLKQKVSKNYAEASSAGIVGTPTFFVNGVKVTETPTGETTEQIAKSFVDIITKLANNTQ
jgi:protein-disulfide isomerase